MSIETDRGRRRADKGRLVALPLMAILGIAHLASTHQRMGEAGSSAEAVAELTRTLLTGGFYALIVALYLVRTRARATTPSLAARVLAVGTTFAPFGVAFVSRPVHHPLTLVVANALLCCGLAWSVWSLHHLGRSFSIVAQARELVQTGPYRFVRHPLYLGELVALLGVVLAGFTWGAFALFTVVVGLQLYRASKEEELLADSFPEYAAYRLRTARIVPNVL